MTANIAVVLPSRGTIFSETVEELLRELKPYEHKIFWAHGLPIPDCFEVPTRKALAGDFTHLLVVEEDMIIPPGTLKSLLEADEDAITCDYPVTRNGHGTIRYIDSDTALYTGCGFLLVKMNVLKKLKAPIWRDDVTWKVRGDTLVAKPAKDERYGKQDISFGIRMHLRGTPIKVSPIYLGQRRIAEYGENRTNIGAHAIEEWTEVTQSRIGEVEIDYTFVEGWL